jgi:hypothetical protein
VIERRFLGEWVALHLAVEGLDGPIGVKVEGHEAPPPGAEVGVKVDAASVFAFPANGGSS